MSSDPLAGLTEPEIMNVDTPISLVGEIGSGKGHRARLIHERRVGKGEKPPFLRVALNTLGNGDMMRRELFGIGPGMATGVPPGPGVFERAEDGTVFLDELHLAPLDVQRQLLTVLDERTVRRIGETEPRVLHAKLITGTQHPLEDLVDAGVIVGDLFSRLEDGPILRVPPLRAATAAHFADLFSALCQKMQFEPPGGALRERLWALTMKHAESAWPRNIRQLESAIKWARDGRSIREIGRKLERSWSGRRSAPLQEAPVGQLQSLMPLDVDTQLLATLLELSIPPRPGSRNPSKGGRKTKVIELAAEIADLLLDERRMGTLKADLEALIGKSKSSLNELDRAIDAWVGHGILQPARRDRQDAFLLVWPAVEVYVTFQRGGISCAWNSMNELGDGDIVTIHVRSRLPCRVRVATLGHPVEDEVYEDLLDWGEDDDGEPMDPEDYAIDADGRRFTEWSLDFTLDDTPGWEQYIVHLVPELPPSEQRGPTRGRPKTRRSATDTNAVVQAREIARRYWGRGWMTDFVVRKKEPSAD